MFGLRPGSGSAAHTNRIIAGGDADIGAEPEQALVLMVDLGEVFATLG
jgi:hypothetical protein